MRKLPAVLAALSLSAVTLTGCAVTTVGGDTCVRASFDDDVSGIVTVTGSLGSAPNVSMHTPVRVSESSFTDLIDGDGVPLTADTQPAAIELALYSGETGDLVISSPFDGDLTRLSNIDYWAGQIPGLVDALRCAAEGTRTLVAISPEDLGEPARQGLGLGAGDSVIAVVDVLKTYLPHAQGTLQFNAGRGLPSVVRAPDGRPGVIIPDTDPPSELVTQVLIKGEGEPVTGDGTFRVHYTGLTWADSNVFDSSWDTAPAQFSLEGLIAGVSTALEGQTVGSQVLVVVPPELGYGDVDQGSIPAGSTLVFVFDIVGIDAPPAG